MWLWILSFVFLALVWVAWWFLQPPEGVPETEIFPLWVAIVITAVVVLALVTLVVVRRIRAARAARALEKAIAQQAQEQVAAARPEERAEIQALQRQMLEGIRALKGTRLGEGGDALYALPWYVMIGPPGAGKTTALRHSGLTFPYLDPNGQGVRGVGGTRNCDWWFTNEAILLDTAGRYTTEAEDRDEWLAFLDTLKLHRKHKPLNGVVVAVSVSDLIDASEEEILRTAERVRERIDEVQERLRMVLPVYVLFTKCDLVAGFVEFFGELKRSERGQAWGATLPLTMDRSNVSAIFDREFDLLVEQLHKRTILRIANPRSSRSDRERVYQFPLEFAAIKRNLSDFMGACFAPAAVPANRKVKVPPAPTLRGFYFTSGTQEGRPLDRVVGAMGRAFGLRPVEREDQAGVESKSYFLKEVFTNVVFPDQDVAGRTEDEITRVRWQRIAIAAAALVVAAILCIPAIFSYLDNRDLVTKTERVSQEVGRLDWTQPAVANVDKLDALRAHLEQLDDWKENGPPVSMRWGMYVGDDLFDPALEHYTDALKWGLVEPVTEHLEGELKKASGANYLEEYNNLKTYLLLNDKPAGSPAGTPSVHLNQGYDEWEIGRLTQIWAQLLRPRAGDISESDLRAKLQPHVRFYVDLLRRGIVEGPELDKAVIASTRDALTRVGANQRYYAEFVDSLIEEKIDEAGPNTPDNLKYPPITLDDMFQDRPEVLTKLSSKRKKREGAPQKIRGPYTADGRRAVLAKLKDGYSILEREKWVVPPTTEEKQQKDQILRDLGEVRQDYDNQYIREWTEFFRDIDVYIPQNNIEAIEGFRILSTPDWPYHRLIRALRDNTQFEEERKKAEEAAKADGGVVDQIKQRVERKIESKTRTPGLSAILSGGGDEKSYVDPVPEKFKSMVEFGFPAPAKEGEPPPPSGLSSYIGNLETLAGEMTIIEEGPNGASPAEATKIFEKAVGDTEQKLLSLDRFGQELMHDLLLNPLRQSYQAMIKSAGGAASGLWEVEVWPVYRDTIKNRYPFNATSKRDASFEDVAAFYKPKDGILWGFYEAYLGPFHKKVGHKFMPATHLTGVPAPARRNTPFNPLLYNCLERSDEITDALFAQGQPGIKFRINLTTVSPIVSEIIFELDGKQRIYKNEKEFWHEFVWPGEAALTGASIRIVGAGGLDEEIRRDGPWGLWRLLDAGRHTAVKDDDKVFRVEWLMSAPPVTVKMQIKPTRANHPFPYDFFRNTNCPSGIGDYFGPPPG
jgi:type VI secretion system protein ImpL